MRIRRSNRYYTIQATPKELETIMAAMDTIADLGEEGRTSAYADVPKLLHKMEKQIAIANAEDEED